MPHDVTLSVTGSLDDTAALGTLLDTDPELRGRVRRVAAPAPEGTLSGGLPELIIALGSSGVATALASVIVVWLRQRTGSVAVHVKRPDGTRVDVVAERVRTLSGDELRAHVDQLTAQLSANADAAGT